MHLQRKYLGQCKPALNVATPCTAVADPARPPKDVYFAQTYGPGDRAQSDFTCMNSLNITIRRESLATKYQPHEFEGPERKSRKII